MNMPHPSDTPEAGLRAHFDAHRGALRRMLAARLGSAEDADDLVQDLWIRLGSVESGPVANPRAYLHRMALNLANDLVRERVRRRRREEDWNGATVETTGGMALDQTPSPERQLADRQELDRMTQVVRSMPERAQQVFRLHRIEGMSHARVAEDMGISKSAVEKNMATAMKHLARHMILGDGI
jgi:RNA polymerase sigma-70 factor (ECF subfamily)